jgi:hypothetical protein
MTSKATTTLRLTDTTRLSIPPNVPHAYFMQLCKRVANVPHAHFMQLCKRVANVPHAHFMQLCKRVANVPHAHFMQLCKRVANVLRSGHTQHATCKLPRRATHSCRTLATKH